MEKNIIFLTHYQHMDVLYSNSTTTNKKDGIPNGMPFIG